MRSDPNQNAPRGLWPGRPHPAPAHGTAIARTRRQFELTTPSASTYDDGVEIDRIAVLVQAVSGDDPVASLGALAELRREMERREAVLVRRARTQGRTWADIAVVLGVSKQAVHKKYGGGGLFRNEK